MTSWAVTSTYESYQRFRSVSRGENHHTLDASLELAYRELVVLDTTTQMSLLQKESCDIVRVSLASLRMMHHHC